MERSGTLSEPSDNSTTPYIKKETNPFGSASFSFRAFSPAWDKNEESRSGIAVEARFSTNSSIVTDEIISR